MTAEDRVRSAVAELTDALIALARESTPPAEARPVELISVDELARRAGIGRSSAWLLVSDGRIRSVKVGGRRVVPVSELARLADGRPPA